jgi:hypothetical protein
MKQLHKTLRASVLLAFMALGCDHDSMIAVGVYNADAGPSIIELPANDQCVDDDDCDSKECVPTVDAVVPNVGSCWSSEFVGCERVDFADWVVIEFCNDLALAVCQSAQTPEMAASCADPSGPLDPWIANFKCCDSSIL